MENCKISLLIGCCVSYTYVQKIPQPSRHEIYGLFWSSSVERQKLLNISHVHTQLDPFACKLSSRRSFRINRIVMYGAAMIQCSFMLSSVLSIPSLVPGNQKQNDDDSTTQYIRTWSGKWSKIRLL